MSKKQELSKKAQKPERKPMRAANANNLEYDGTIVENMGNTNFKVQLDINEDLVLVGTISGKMRMHYIKILAGDRVKVEMSPYDLTKGRISFRYK